MDVSIINAVAAIASAVAAGASVLIAVHLSKRAEALAEVERQRVEALAASESERAAALAASERRHASFNTVAEWRRDLREWAAETINVLTQVTYLFEDPENTDADSHAFSCRYRLSSLIDRGRFFLPNIRRDEYGIEKPYAYRGYRHSGLDPLVAAERVLSTGFTGAFTDRKHALVAMKREFVSSMQQILDPEGQNQEVARMIREGHEATVGDRTFGGLLEDDGKIPLGAEAMLLNPPSKHLGLRHDQS